MRKKTRKFIKKSRKSRRRKNKSHSKKIWKKKGGGEFIPGSIIREKFNSTNQNLSEEEEMLKAYGLSNNIPPPRTFHPEIFRYLPEENRFIARPTSKHILDASKKAAHGIRHLTFDEKDSIDKIEKMLVKHPNVTYVKIENPTDEKIQSISDNCPHLEEIELVNCHEITDKSLDIISTIPDSNGNETQRPVREKLRTVILKNSRTITEYGIQLLSQNCDTLTKIMFVNCVNLNDQALDTLASWNKNLISITLEACYKITDNGVIEIAKNNLKLLEISLRLCNNITETAIISLANHCPNLTSIDFSFTNIRDNGVVAVARNCRHLVHVNLNYCENITDDAIIALAKKCPKLTSIDFSNTTINDKAVIALANNCPKLTEVSLRNCENITVAAIIALAENCHNLSKINVENTKVTYNDIDDLNKTYNKLSSIIPEL
jgi:hypothetical protein